MTPPEASAPGSAGAPAALPGPVRGRTDPRLTAYLVAGLGALIVAIATSRPEWAALGAPLLALVAVGMMPAHVGSFRGGVRLFGGPVVEGDEVEGEVTLDWDGEAEVDVVLARARGVVPVEPAPVVGWALPLGSGPVTLPFRLRARSWGVHELGALWIRVRRPGSFRMIEHRVASTPSLRVLPTVLRLNRILRSAEPRAFAGAHLSRSRGSGTDFAELRPYRPGDRLRDLSWGASARMGAPWVTVHHPERTGTVLLYVDSLFSHAQTDAVALARGARAAWAVASAHLRAQDRVGLLVQGRSTAWLLPRAGRRARWMLLDELLTVGRAAEDAAVHRPPRGRIVVPPDALVVGVTDLRSQTFAPYLLRYRRAGHATVALVIDTEDLLPRQEGRVAAAARCIWLAQREAERSYLARGGVPTALVRETDGVGPAIMSLCRRLDARQHTTGGGGAWP